MQNTRALSHSLKCLGLLFGCIDLAADRQGRLRFLQVNQQGQFLSVEEAVPQTPLLRAMSAMRMSGRTDYALESGVDGRVGPPLARSPIDMKDESAAMRCRRNDGVIRLRSETDAVSAEGGEIAAALALRGLS